MVARYPDWMSNLVETVFGGEPEQYVSRLTTLANHVVTRSQQVEEWFGRGAASAVPVTLFTSLEAMCRELKLPNKRAVLVVGRADNLETLLDDLTAAFFGSLQEYELPEDLPFGEFAMIQIPRLEGSLGIWWPLILGHEVAHLKCEDGGLEEFDVLSRITWTTFDNNAIGRRSRGNALRQTFSEHAARWAAELLCDALAVFRFGPAAVASLAEFLDVNGDIGVRSRSHPPGLLRVRLALLWLGEDVAPQMEAALESARDIALQSYEDAFAGRWADSESFIRFVGIMEGLGNAYLDEAASWFIGEGGEAPRQKYRSQDRQQLLDCSIDDLKRGSPPMDRYLQDGGQVDVSFEDVINAGWAFRTPGSGELVSKALDNIDLVRKWRHQGRAIEAPGAEPLEGEHGLEGGIVPAAVLRQRLNRRGDPRLVVNPCLEFSLGNAALDLHLGTKFIVFKRTRTASLVTAFDFDPQGMQELIEIALGEEMTLHPNETVLTATLEYLALPLDMGAQVVTRSSYGRLGLITATAVQVHPGFQGCLTLELLNVGPIPLVLTPGERVAQLVFYGVNPPAQPGKSTFHYATGPQFSRGRTEPEEQDVIRQWRDELSSGPGTPPVEAAQLVDNVEDEGGQN
jgi:deoxycytidine triphosphate deaminase